MTINVVSCDEKYYIRLCRLNSKLGRNEKKLIKCFKNITPRHGIEQELHISFGYHVILFTMLLITHGTDLPTLSYSILNNEKFHLTESSLIEVQNWLVNESLLPLRHEETVEIIGYRDYDDDNDSLVLSTLYKSDSISNESHNISPGLDSVQTYSPIEYCNKNLILFNVHVYFTSRYTVI